VLFTIVVPGAGAVYAPWLILTHAGAYPQPVAWYALILVALGLALYAWCLWLFATVGRGTPGPWDAPRRFVVVGPYRWVRNPIYIGALVVWYEEPALHTLFGEQYDDYHRKVSRWIPRQPSTNSFLD
jgi:protein-S-isoprenylcysteine O-methyltransferase Ste14